MVTPYGSTFADPGAIRTDLVDGSGSLVGVWSGASIDVNAPGSYYLVYSYTDTAGNASAVVRSVTVSTPQYG